MRRDTLLAAMLEAGLLLVAALLAFFFQAPLIFSSLGPTAYELIETPERKSAQPRSILGGHAIGILAGLLAIFVTHAYSAPAISLHRVAFARLLAVLLAAFLTVAGTLTLEVTQPAALSTTLLIALGTMQTGAAVLSIAGSIVVMVLIGEPIRRRRETKLRANYQML